MKRKSFISFATAIMVSLALAPIGFAQSGPTPLNSPARPTPPPSPPNGPIQDPNAPQPAPNVPRPVPQTPIPDPNTPIQDPNAPGMPNSPGTQPPPVAPTAPNLRVANAIGNSRY
jgi:hypothetical protein